MRLGRFYLKKEDQKLAKKLKSILGFKPGNLTVYKIALTHKAATKQINLGVIKEDNERLEFLGDSVLDTVVAELIFQKFPLQNEGFLTEMKAKMVSRNQLNYIAQKLHLSSFFVNLERVQSRSGSSNTLGGNALEALIGAIYLDKGFKKTRKFIKSKIIEAHLDLNQLVQTEISYKGRLHEYAQKNKVKLEFIISNSFTKNKMSYYTIQLSLDNKIIAETTNHSKKKAEEIVSEKAYQILEIESSAT